MKLYTSILAIGAILLSTTVYGYKLVDDPIQFENAGGCDIRQYTFADGMKKTIIILLTKQSPYRPYYYEEYDDLLDKVAITEKVKELDKLATDDIINTGNLGQKLDLYLKKPFLHYIRNGYRAFKGKSVKNNQLVEVDETAGVSLEFNGKKWLASQRSSSAGTWLYDSHCKEYGYCDAIRTKIEHAEFEARWQGDDKKEKRYQRIISVVLIGSGIVAVVGLIYAAKKIYDSVKKKRATA